MAAAMSLDALLVAGGLIALGLVMVVLVLRPGWRPRVEMVELLQSPHRLPHAPEHSIFISYRRADSEHVVGRLYEHLTAKLGANAVFKDIDKIAIGSDFRGEIEGALEACLVFVCVIGKAWPALSDGGKRRIDDPGDFVRIEIETALKRGLPIIPVLVGGLDRLPSDFFSDSLSELAYRQGLRLRPDPDFRGDVDHLMASLAAHLEAARI
jgi:TIR domain